MTETIDVNRLQFGLDTFGDVTHDESGELKPQAQVIRDVIEEAALADQVGIDVIGLGEHHRPDFAVSSPDVILAAIAARTERIRLNTSVTVLSTDDPVRVYERFATLHAISHGRAEVTVGRGSFVESYPLFGYSLADYETLFEEKLDLLVKTLDEGPIQWEGSIRPPLTGQRAYPHTQGRLTVRVGVGGTPASVVRAARHGLPLAVAIIGGPAERFAPLVDLYRRELAERGRPALQIGVHSPGHVADSDEQAREEAWPGYRDLMNRIGAERGWAPMTRGAFEAEVDGGSLYVGSPQTVASRIADTIGTLNVDRFDLKYATGPMPHSQLMRSIELFGTEVIPQVRDRLSSSPTSGLT